MRKELCYRVVNADGVGLYASGHHVAGELHDMYRHPTPSDDYKLRDFYYEHISNGLYFRNSPYVFGFASMEQLRHWIHSEELLMSLAESGFRIRIYQTDDYCIGDTQMVFRGSTASLVGEAKLI